MRVRLILLVVAIGTICAGQAQAQVPPGFLHEVLANGLRVSILPDQRSPVVATQIFYHVGAVHEPAGQAGLAHLLEHLMFRSVTASGDATDLDDHVRRHGGYLNAFTSPDETVYVSEIAPEHHGRLLELEAARMAGFHATQPDLDRERRIVAEEQRLRFENHPEARLGLQAARAALGAHPYNHIGTETSLATITLKAVESFFADYYRPNNAHLVIVGPVDGPATMATVRRLFSSIPGGGLQPRDAPPLLGWRFPEEIEIWQGLAPIKGAALCFPLPPEDAPDHYALLILGQLLSKGRTNLLEDELVKRRKVAVGAGVVTESLRRGGGVALYAAYLPYRRKATAFKLLFEARAILVKRQAEWLTEATVRSGKRALRRTELQQRYSAREQAHALGLALLHQGDVRLAFTAADRIHAVTLEQVRAVFQRYVVQGRPIRGYARPERVPWWLTLFGWLYPLVAR